MQKNTEFLYTNYEIAERCEENSLTYTDISKITQTSNLKQWSQELITEQG